MSTNIVQSNFVRFDSEGLELVVDTSTGKAYASISATARMLETARSTIQSAILTCRDIQTTSAEILTATGSKPAELIPASAVFKLALKYHPRLAERMGDAGYFEVSQEITEDGKLVPFALVTGKGQIWLKQRLYQSIGNQQKMIAAIAGGVAQMSLL